MAGGAIVATGEVKIYPGRFTAYVLVTCLISATGGLIFGYDIGISGGVTSMDMFLAKFFPKVLRKEKADTGENDWCTFNSQLLTTFTSSLYLAALIASLFASTMTRVLGRRVSMVVGGVLFLIGAALNASAQDLIMLIFGRIFLGFGVGFANQSVPVYLSEMAPSKQRGALNMCFQLFITLGNLIANVINYGTQHLDPWGWRLSLGLAGVPALIIAVGALFLPDTPNSMVERGHEEKARKMLKRIRGTDDVHEELGDLVAACEASKKVQHPWRNILEPKNRPQLIMAICIPMFQQLTGINVIMFYAPVLFKTIGFGSNASLLSSVITGIVNVVSTLVSIFSVDKVGRRVLFIEGGIQMFICQILVGAMLGWQFGVSGHGTMSKSMSSFVLALICIYVAGFAWSWGPLGWLVPSEIFPLETRSAGQAINVAVNMLFTFLVAQLFLIGLCHLKFGLFFLFSFFVLVMTAFIILLLPETRNVPIDEMVFVWKKHWFWKRFFTDDDDDNVSSVKQVKNGDL